MRRREFVSVPVAMAASRSLAAEVPAAIQRLRPMTAGIAPITDAERQQRIEKARRLMAAHKIDAVVLESGPSLNYFTGVRWGRSERLFGTVIPARGELAYVVPRFEEDRARELIRFGKDVRNWQEDDSPYTLVAQILKDRGVSGGTIGIEESVRFFVFDGVRKETRGAEFVSADAVTAGCRIIKSAAELALMQRANDIALAAFRASFPLIKEGMTQYDIQTMIESAFSALGSRGGVTVTVGKYSAFPHGSIQPQRLREGDVVLVDGVGTLEGYHADITRTIVYGKPSDRQRRIWDLERRAQDAALAAARVSATCESVDAAARKVISDAGFGPDYKLPGLPHRTGHGIGLEVHEWTNLVRGNKTPLAPGMCFSDEPMIVIPGEFGIRLEDCFYITEAGPKLFTPQSPAIDRPFA